MSILEENVDGIEENLKNIIKDIVGTDKNREDKDIEDTTRFVEDLGADSLDIVELAMRVEEYLGDKYIITDEDSEKILTYGELVEYVRKVIEDRRESH